MRVREASRTSNGKIYDCEDTCKGLLFDTPESSEIHYEPYFTDVWEEHTTADGRPFFYNRSTKETTWELDDGLCCEEEVVSFKAIGAIRFENRRDAREMFLRELNAQKIRNYQDYIARLSTSPIYRSVEPKERIAIFNEYIRDVEGRHDAYYIDKICKIKIQATNFFEFNSFLLGHPLYDKVKNKPACYERYLAARSDRGEIERMLGDINVDTSVLDVLEDERFRVFDRHDVLAAFSKKYRELESRESL